MSSTTTDFSGSTTPYFIADIGGTNARFALQTAPNQCEHVTVVPCANYITLLDAMRAYLLSVGNPTIRHGAIAIANPIVGDIVKMTNHSWSFSIEELRQTLRWETLLVLNDFTAQALAITQTNACHLIQVGNGFAVPNTPKAVLGPGTGLGVSGLIPSPTGCIALSSEGGHVNFAPCDDVEMAVLQYAQKKFGYVSAERLVSGAGLMLIHQALGRYHHRLVPQIAPADITTRALAHDAICRQALDMFCAILGTVASNLALTLGARGGVYLCGGILPRISDYFIQSPFRRRFEDKGRFSEYVAQIPTYIVVSSHPGLTGTSVALRQHLAAQSVQAA